jgi:DNA-binding transcriptional regulator YiaG
MDNAAREVRELVELHRQDRLPPPDVRRALRLVAGVTQGELAAALGRTRPTITRWENGSREPRGEDRRRYLDAIEELRRA